MSELSLNVSLNTPCWNATDCLSMQSMAAKFKRETQRSTKEMIELRTNNHAQDQCPFIAEPLAVLA